MSVQAVIFDWGGTLTPWHQVDLAGLWHEVLAQHLTGEQAALWTPLVASAPEGSGTSGVLTAVQTENGRQVTYNGHFLYTFAEDCPGLVTGQGFQASLNQLEPFGAQLVKTGVLRSGSVALHLWLIDLREYLKTP